MNNSEISINKGKITIKELLNKIDLSKITINKHDTIDVKSQRFLIERVLIGLPFNISN